MIHHFHVIGEYTPPTPITLASLGNTFLPLVQNGGGLNPTVPLFTNMDSMVLNTSNPNHHIIQFRNNAIFKFIAQFTLLLNNTNANAVPMNIQMGAYVSNQLTIPAGENSVNPYDFYIIGDNYDWINNQYMSSIDVAAGLGNGGIQGSLQLTDLTTNILFLA